jgi:NAD-dependent deacetylase
LRLADHQGGVPAINMFVLTGAGVSAESGLGTFRDKGEGLWTRFDPMKLATPEAFARLEAGLAERGGSLFLCTQNIDDLQAPSRSPSWTDRQDVYPRD